MKKALNGVRTREDVWTLPVWDDTLLWYARASKKMWGRELKDPASWRYQAAIHGYDPNSPMLQAIAKPGEQLPANAGDVWNQCQHFTSFFLPWHRGYLGCFEAIVRETIRGLGGPADDWALPYWDYSDANNPHARLVPPEFLDATWPDGGPNPLSDKILRAPFRPVATSRGQAGDFGIDALDVSLKALDEPYFETPANASSFGGDRTGFNHDQGRGAGMLEITPHGNIHMEIGSDLRRRMYWMGSFETAGLDPLFWIHHCNLDRLWEVWVAKSGSKGNPRDKKWLEPRSAITGKRIPFLLHKPGVANFGFVPKDVLDTKASVFAYVYDRHAVRSTSGSIFEAVLASQEVDMAKPKPKVVGSTDSPVLLESGRAVARVPIAPQRTNLLAALTENRSQGSGRLFLNLENILAEGAATPYRVYLNVPENFEPEDYPGHFVGTLPLFGLREASKPDGAEGGSGLTYSFDVTDVVRALGAAEGSLDVAFVAKAGAEGAPGLRVGKISIHRG